MTEQTVSDERVAFGRKDNRENFFLEQKCHNADSTVAMAIFIREALNTSKCSQNDISPI